MNDLLLCFGVVQLYSERWSDRQSMDVVVSYTMNDGVSLHGSFALVALDPEEKITALRALMVFGLEYTETEFSRLLSIERVCILNILNMLLVYLQSKHIFAYVLYIYYASSRSNVFMIAILICSPN